jgi:hypothetical protein
VTQATDPYEYARLWLKTRRINQLKLTLRAAAVQGHCSDAWLCQIETGTASLARLQVHSLDRLAKAYETTVPVLLRLLQICPACKEGTSTCPR